VKGGDVAVSFEIRSVKRQDALSCVDGHDGNEARIMDLDASDIIVRHNFFPCG
jgi:hypothetical protein